MDALKPELRPIVEQLLGVVEDLPQVVIEHASGSFMAKAPSTFASFRPRAKDIQVSFLLDIAVQVFPITKTLRLSANRVAHRLHGDATEDIDAPLVRWLRQAHDLCDAPKKPLREKAS
jgi:hypothetical protein